MESIALHPDAILGPHNDRKLIHGFSEFKGFVSFVQNSWLLQKFLWAVCINRCLLGSATMLASAPVKRVISGRQECQAMIVT